MSEANGVLRNHYHPPGATIYIEKRLTNQSYRLFSQPLFLLYVISVCKQPKSPPSKYAPFALCFLVARGNVVAGCEDKRDFIFKGILASPLAVESHLPPLKSRRKVFTLRFFVVCDFCLQTQ